MSENKPILFISHSHKDCEKVKIIYDLLINNYIDKEQYKIVFTCIPEGQLGIGDNIADGTLGMVYDSNVFLAYISENYKKSPICMAELGVAHAKNQNKNNNTSTNFIYLLIKDRYIEFNNTTEIGLGRVMMNAENPSTIQTKFDEIFNRKKGTNAEESKEKLLKKFNVIYKSYNHRLDIAVSDIEIFIKKTFCCVHYLYDKPIILYVDRKVYEELSEKLTVLGDQHLLWTTFKSPLNIEKTKLNEAQLTKYDRVFKETISNIKQRLIIFLTEEEQNEYLEPKDADVVRRRNAFNDANKDCLFYTTQQAIITSYNALKRDKGININKPKNELYLEFAFMRSKESTVLFFSDFDNATFHSDGTQDEPIIFINPDIKHKIVFGQKIIGSLFGLKGKS